MIERLQSNIEHFETVQQNCIEYFEQNGLSKKEREIVFVLAQYDLFGMVSSLTWKSIAEIIELGKQTTRNHLKKAREQRYRPSRFKKASEIQTLSGSRTDAGNLRGTRDVSLGILLLAGVLPPLLCPYWPFCTFFCSYSCSFWNFWNNARGSFSYHLFFKRNRKTEERSRQIKRSFVDR